MPSKAGVCHQFQAMLGNYRRSRHLDPLPLPTWVDEWLRQMAVSRCCCCWFFFAKITKESSSWCLLVIAAAASAVQGVRVPAVRPVAKCSCQQKRGFIEDQHWLLRTRSDRLISFIVWADLLIRIRLEWWPRLPCHVRHVIAPPGQPCSHILLLYIDLFIDLFIHIYIHCVKWTFGRRWMHE